MVLHFVCRLVVIVQRFLRLELLEADVTLVHESAREMNILNVIQQIVLQSHVLSANGALKATSTAFWPYNVCLQNISVFLP